MEKHAAEFGGGLIAAILAGAIASWQFVVAVFILYAILLLGNLITGLLFAFQTHTYDPEKGRQAVYKKLGLITGIIILIFFDWIIMGMARSAGVIYSIPFFAIILTGYSAAHELSSMIGNIKKLGNKVPKYIDEATAKAEEALDQGKIPDLIGILKGKKAGE